jgi:hypothetical protein
MYSYTYSSINKYNHHYNNHVYVENMSYTWLGKSAFSPLFNLASKLKSLLYKKYIFIIIFILFALIVLLFLPLFINKYFLQIYMVIGLSGLIYYIASPPLKLLVNMLNFAIVMCVFMGSLWYWGVDDKIMPILSYGLTIISLIAGISIIM